MGASDGETETGFGWRHTNQAIGHRIDLTMRDTYQTIRLEVLEKRVLVVRLDRPEAMNALNTQMGVELTEVFEELTEHPSHHRCVILTGTGEKAFCAGGDLKERDGMSDAVWLHQHRVFERAFRAMLFCPVPIIAAVNGAAFGGGCEMVCASDWAYAADTARFAQTETKLGIIPGGGGTQTLARAVGIRRAKELILTARIFSAHEALEWGLVNAVVPLADLFPRALEAARQVAANSPLATRQAKIAISRSPDLPLHEGLSFEIEAYNRAVVSPDRVEGIRAFNEKRPPRWED